MPAVFQKALNARWRWLDAFSFRLAFSCSSARFSFDAAGRRAFLVWLLPAREEKKLPVEDFTAGRWHFRVVLCLLAVPYYYPSVHTTDRRPVTRMKALRQELLKDDRRHAHTRTLPRHRPRCRRRNSLPRRRRDITDGLPIVHAFCWHIDRASSLGRNRLGILVLGRLIKRTRGLIARTLVAGSARQRIA